MKPKVAMVRQDRQHFSRLLWHTKKVQYAEGKLVESLNTGRGDKDKTFDSFGCCSDQITGGDGVCLFWPIATFPPMQHQSVLLTHDSLDASTRMSCSSSPCMYS